MCKHLLTIGGACDELGLLADVLRWHLNQLQIRPVQTVDGVPFYLASDIERVRKILSVGVEHPVLRREPIR